MAKTNVSFWYGIIDGDTVHLYVLVYATSAIFSDEGSSGSIKKFKVISFGTSQAPQTKHYTFTKGTLDTIRINFNLNGSQNTDKEVKIVVADLDQTSAITPVLPLPNLQGELALDVPYVYTEVISANEFRAEMVVIPETGRTFNAAPKSGPDGNKNTLSTVTYSLGSILLFTPSPHLFTVPNVAADPNGGYTFEYRNGKIRKSRTRNNNHTAIPFPRPRRKPKP